MEADRIEIGCQGWNYNDWVGRPGMRAFYPQGTRPAEMLDLYARAFNTVEVDSTFYAIPSEATVRGWRARSPVGFTFALKLVQQITHERELVDSDALLVEFCARARALGEKLAAVLVQLPPTFDASPARAAALCRFLDALPSDIRFYLEFRHSDWANTKTLAMLNERGVAFALVEGPWIARATAWQLAGAQTLDFAYVRWMGARDLTHFDRVQRPQDENLRAWSDVLRDLARRGTHVFGYFSNFYEGHAPASANKLKRLLGQATTDPDDLESQPSLFS